MSKGWGMCHLILLNMAVAVIMKAAVAPVKMDIMGTLVIIVVAGLIPFNTVNRNSYPILNTCQIKCLGKTQYIVFKVRLLRNTASTCQI